MWLCRVGEITLLNVVCVGMQVWVVITLPNAVCGYAGLEEITLLNVVCGYTGLGKCFYLIFGVWVCRVGENYFT